MQKRPTILRSLLIVATPQWQETSQDRRLRGGGRQRDRHERGLEEGRGIRGGLFCKRALGLFCKRALGLFCKRTLYRETKRQREAVKRNTGRETERQGETEGQRDKQRETERDT